MKWIRGHYVWLVGGVLAYALLVLSFSAAHGLSAPGGAVAYGQELAAVFSKPTYSSPIALSNPVAAGGPSLVWVVNPDDDSVSVIRTDTNAVIKKIAVGDEPQSVAVGPNNEYAYVANAAGNSVTVIKIFNANPAAFDARIDNNVGVGGNLTTGAEPWNIVISPDGKRVFVANSSQDTITVINGENRTLIGNVNLRDSLCNDPDRTRHFQPRGLAVSIPDGAGNARLYVTRFLSFTKAGGVQGDDNGKEGLVCRLNINTNAATIAGFTPAAAIRLAAQDSGFVAKIGTPPVDTPTSAYPNQMQSIVIRGDKAYLPNIAASPSRPLVFNIDTQAFVSRIDNLAATESDGGAINLHLGARDPEPGKTKLFFANPWAIAFTNASGAGAAYVASAGSDLLVKLNVAADGTLSNSVDGNTTRYIDLNDPNNPAASGPNAGKNPLGLVITDDGTRAYVMNDVSRNVSVVDLTADSVAAVIKTYDLPPPGTLDEVIHVGKEMFFSSRGNFNRPNGTSISTQNRLSSEGWQNCASCHFAGLTDGVVWQFGTGPRKSVPMNGTWNPQNPDDQRVLNYSGIFDEVQDFEANIRNVSGPGALAAAQPCANPPPATSTFDPNHGLLIGDNGDINLAPCAIPSLRGKANAGRPQHTVTLPGSTVAVPALDALKEWVRFAIRTPNAPLTTAELTAGGGNATGGVDAGDIAAGRTLFLRAGCQTCHGGGKWSNSVKNFTSPPADGDVATENQTTAPNANAAQFFFPVLRDIGSFNLNVPGVTPLNQIPGQPLIGAVEKDAANKDALGKDHDGDGKGNGYNMPSLLGLLNLQPYYHNGSCETLACVVANVQHRTAGLRQGRPDPLTNPADQARLVAFLESIDANTAPATNLRIFSHDIFFDPPTVIAGQTVEVGANISLFGPKVPSFTPGPLKVTFFDGAPGAAGTTVIGEADLAGVEADFGQVTVQVPWNVPNEIGRRRIFVTVDRTDLFEEDNENDNTAVRRVRVNPVPPDRTPPEVSEVLINDGAAITNSRDVTVKFKASDPSSPGGAQTSGLDSFCLVRYTFDAAQRRWVEEQCSFTRLPTAAADGSFTVNTRLRPREGVAYVFVWVKDKAGNVSRTPGLDVISFVPNPDTDIELNRNDVRIFRISLNPGQSLTFTVTPSLGDVDVSVFQGIAADSPRIALSANNGTQPETVSFSVPGGGSATTFQVEIRAAVNSRFRIAVSQTAAAVQEATGTAVQTAAKRASDTPIVGGPPALRAAIDEPLEIFVPFLRR